MCANNSAELDQRKPNEWHCVLDKVHIATEDSVFQALASKLHTACHKAWRCLDRNRLRHGGFSFSDGGDGTIRPLLSVLCT